MTRLALAGALIAALIAAAINPWYIGILVGGIVFPLALFVVLDVVGVLYRVD